LSLNRLSLIVLYSAGLLLVGAVLVKGIHYYTAPLELRPHSSLHLLLKPGGKWGHGLGILGSSMMLLLFLYSLRKRQKFGLRFGKIRHWLNIHIFFGVMGPIFVTLHTSFKFGGIVAVSYYSMIAVMLSGFIGRYLYVQIPRALSGDELTLRQMDEQNMVLTKSLAEDYRLSENVLTEIKKLSLVNENQTRKGLSLLIYVFVNDLIRPFKIRQIRRNILSQRNIPMEKADHVLELIREKSLLMRKMSLLSSIKPLFHYWHVAHKPFAYVMIIIMFVHIAVTILFGYRWIF